MTIFKTYRLKGVRAPLHRKIKWLWQRITRGFDDTELWNLDSTIAEFVLPRLKAFRDDTYGYPAQFETLEEWQQVIDKMIFFLEHKIDNGWIFDKSSDEMLETNRKYEEGKELFMKYFDHLWY